VIGFVSVINETYIKIVLIYIHIIPYNKLYRIYLNLTRAVVAKCLVEILLNYIIYTVHTIPYMKPISSIYYTISY